MLRRAAAILLDPARWSIVIGSGSPRSDGRERTKAAERAPLPSFVFATTPNSEARSFGRISGAMSARVMLREMSIDLFY